MTGEYCRDTGFTNVEVVTDLRRDLDHRKKGLQRLLLDIPRGRVPMMCERQAYRSH
jgi:hypothetical protein